MENLTEYFVRVTGLTPIPTQVEILKMLEDTTVKDLALCCGRGYSKSLMCAIAALYFADVYSDAVGRPISVLLVSGQDSIYKHLDTIFHDNEELRNKLVTSGVIREIPKEGFMLQNRSTVETVLATHKRVRGSRCDVLILDECFMIKDDIIKDACLPTLTGEISKIIIISTPSSDNGYFIDMITEPKKYGYKVMQYSSELAPWQKESNKRLKTTLTTEAYAREVLARLPSKSERSYFSKKSLDRIFIDCEPTQEGRPDSRIEIGIDLATGLVCHTCLTVVEKRRSSNKIKVVYQKVYRDFNAKEIIEDCKRFRPASVKADSLPEELFNALKTLYLNIIEVCAKTHKDSILTQLQTAIRTGQLIIPKPTFMSLYSELVKYKRGKRTGDDRVDSLGLAVWYPTFTVNAKHGGIYIPKNYKTADSKFHFPVIHTKRYNR